MASVKQWVDGARIRTLPAALAPVLFASAAAFADSKFIFISEGAHGVKYGVFSAIYWQQPGFSWALTAIAFLVALCFQIGVNFANDYSDGVRGTDEYRVGPARLTGGKLARPITVKLVALSFLFAGCTFGLGIVALTRMWWFIVCGLLAVLAAWFYTGGKNPYGYLGLGEVFVFLTFGLLATYGTYYTQMRTLNLPVILGGCSMGIIACALLMVNNIRDIPTDRKCGKHTLAVRLGDNYARRAYIGFIILALGQMIYFVPLTILCWPLAFLCAYPVYSGATGTALVIVLRQTGLLELAFAVLATINFLFL